MIYLLMTISLMGQSNLSENDLDVENKGLINLGFKPILLDESLIEDVKFISDRTKESFNNENVLTSPKW